MSWFTDQVDRITHAETVDFVITGPLTVDGALPTLPPLTPDKSYLEIRVKALRLPFKREWGSKYHGVVHAFADLASRTGESAAFAAASTPSALAGLDAKNVSNVLTIDKRMIGPTPWSGGALKLQIGLFSVVAQDLAVPFLTTISALSEKVGGALVAAAKPFVDIITASVKDLSQQEGSVRLAIGLDWSPADPQTGYYVIVAAPKNALKDAKFDLDKRDFRLRVNGADYVAAPYLVFGIGSGDRQERWGEIEGLKAAYETVRRCIVENNQSEAQEAFNAFRRLALTSPDLIETDAATLVKKVEDMMKTVFGASVRKKLNAPSPPAFDRLALYDS